MSRRIVRPWLAIIACALLPFAAPQAANPIQSLKQLREQGVVMQRWENSCAAASVATVLTYAFHDPTSEREAAEQMLVATDPARVRARGGFSLLDLKTFVVARGYDGNAYRGLSFDDIRAFHAPIVPIDAKGYNHYVVVNGVVGQEVLLADPAFGNRRMDKSEFERIWMDGIAFVITRAEAP